MAHLLIFSVKYGMAHTGGVGMNKWFVIVSSMLLMAVMIPAQIRSGLRLGGHWKYVMIQGR